jgi:hypothetical protein
MLARPNVELLAARCSDRRPRKATAETGVVLNNPLTGTKAGGPHWARFQPHLSRNANITPAASGETVRHLQTLERKLITGFRLRRGAAGKT